MMKTDEKTGGGDEGMEGRWEKTGTDQESCSGVEEGNKKVDPEQHTGEERMHKENEMSNRSKNIC